MQELITLNKQSQIQDDPVWKLPKYLSTLAPSVAQDFKSCSQWKSLYTEFDVEKCVNKIRGLSYLEEMVPITLAANSLEYFLSFKIISY
jgi:hypothetical protein